MAADLQTTAVTAYATTKSISVLQDQLAETIKRLDAEAEATAADADTICEALDGLKETLGVDSLSDPAAAVLMSQAKAHEPGKPPPIDVGRQALAEADQERKSQLAAQAADARRAKAGEEAALRDEAERLRAEIATVDESCEELQRRQEELDAAFGAMVMEQNDERQLAARRVAELSTLHDRLDTMSRLMAVLGPYNKELESELHSLEDMLAAPSAST